MAEALSAILKIAQGIAKAAETARRNRARCRDLAGRARTVGDILCDSSKAAADDTATRRAALGRLKDALTDALKLVESCNRSSGWLYSILASGRLAGRFDDVERRITGCVGDLGLANDARLEKLVRDLATARQQPRTAKKPAGSKEKDKKKKAVPKNGSNNNNTRNKGRSDGGGQRGGNGGKQTRGKAAVPVTPAPPRQPGRQALPTARYGQGYGVHSIEDDPTACSVM